MTNHGYDRFADALVFVHGPRAEAEAALHAALCRKSGDEDTAETWRKVQSTLAAKRQNQNKAA